MYIAVNGRTNKVLGHNPRMYAYMETIITEVPGMDDAEGLEEYDVKIYECVPCGSLAEVKMRRNSQS